jgi:hypothetical protein
VRGVDGNSSRLHEEKLEEETPHRNLKFPMGKELEIGISKSKVYEEKFK